MRTSRYRRWHIPLGLMTLGVFAPIRAQTVDFESAAYISGNTFVDVDTWTKSVEIPATSPDNFRIQGGPGNKWANILTHSTSSVFRNFPDRPGIIDLRWRWRANGDSVHLCLGVSGNSGATKISSRALACINPQGLFEGQGQISVTSNEGWVKQTWYYMHMTLDPNANKYTLYIANDSLRLDERVALPTSAMNGVGPLSRINVRAENGAGTVDIDDITWEGLSFWVGESDSLGSNAKNWNPVGVPDSLTNIAFNENSGLNCFVDKNILIKSITVPTTWKGSLNIGSSALSILGKIDLTGGKYFFQPGGMIRLSSPKYQNLIGPEPGKAAPPIRHDGIGILRIDTRALYVASFHQARGHLDFNGQDFVVSTDFAITNGQPAT
jgi:hypothetical protein